MWHCLLDRGEAVGEGVKNVKENIVNNVVRTLPGGRWLLDLVR